LVPVLSRDNYFTGNYGILETENIHCSLVFDALRFHIWETRLQNFNLSYPTIETETLDLLGTIAEVSPRIRNGINNNSLLYTDGAQRGGQRGDDSP
jgi:hypothetical protein